MNCYQRAKSSAANQRSPRRRRHTASCTLVRWSMTAESAAPDTQPNLRQGDLRGLEGLHSRKCSPHQVDPRRSESALTEGAILQSRVTQSRGHRGPQSNMPKGESSIHALTKILQKLPTCFEFNCLRSTPTTWSICFTNPGRAWHVAFISMFVAKPSQKTFLILVAGERCQS